MRYVVRMNIKVIGKKIRDKRIHDGISQDALATKAGVCRASIMKMERGEHIPRFDRMLKILKTVNLPISAAI
jgi:transcriptional regulator with XRE-family HTH domain